MLISLAPWAHYALVTAFALTLTGAVLSAWAGHTERRALDWAGHTERGAPAWQARQTRLARLAQQFLLLAWLLATGAAAVLMTALVTDNFAFAYVAGHSSLATPLVFKIGSFWGGQEGSLLLWLWILLTFTGIVSLFGGSPRTRELEPYALAVLLGVATFFAALVAFVEDPFTLSLPAPADGAGLNPLLQDEAMMMHPLALYAGYVGFAVPFAFAVAALLKKRADAAWLRLTRRYTLVAWGFLSLGILLGGNWAYRTLGWGGYWGWDPVENASLMPWLVATAFLHSAMIQEKRGMLKLWNVILVIGTYILTLVGTFITRSGVLQSVHSFAESDIGTWFLAFIGVNLLAALYLVLSNLEILQDDRRIESYVSKESSFLLQNVIFVSLALAVLWGTLFPLVSGAMGVTVSVGAPYFNRVTAPLFVALLILMGIGPLLAWRRASLAQLRQHLLVPLFTTLGFTALLVTAGVRQFGAVAGFSLAFLAMAAVVYDTFQALQARYRLTGEAPWISLPALLRKNPRRYGGYLVHLAVGIIVIGVVGSQAFTQELTTGLGVGESARLGRYTLTFAGLHEREVAGIREVYAEVEVALDGHPVGEMLPGRRFVPEFLETQGPVTELAIRSTTAEDLYVVLAGWDETGRVAGFKFYVNPLVSWIWYGGVLLLAGTLFSLWPRRREQEQTARERILQSWSELEYDYQMGKLGEAEYQTLRARYAQEAMAAEAAQASERTSRLRLLEEEVRARTESLRGHG